MRSLRVIQTPVRSYPHIGGVELHVHHISQQLTNLGHQVTVIAGRSVEHTPIKITYSIKLLPWLFKVTNTEITYTLPLELLRSSFDVIHSHIPTPWTSDWSMIIGTMLKKKKVITIHNDMNKDGFFAYWLTRLYVMTGMRMSLWLADKIIIVNPDWEKSFTFTKSVLLQFKHKIVTIPNAVDIEIFSPIDNKLPLRVLTVSVLDKYHDFKGIPYLLEAFQNVVQHFPQASLQIVGEGELKEKYRALATKLGIETHVIFSGRATHKELATYYSQATVFVLPSTDTEGFGLVLLESLACGTPVITTPIAGVVKDILNTRCGVVVPIKDASMIAKNIIQYFKDPELVKKHGLLGQKLVKEHYTWPQVTKQIEQIYYSI